MTLALTPHMLEAAYELLRTTPPFRGWKLPPADDVEFRVKAIPHQGEFFPPARIVISAQRVGTLDRLAVVMAHEMVHFRLQLVGSTDKEDHGPDFQRCAARVCRHHLFDPKEF